MTSVYMVFQVFYQNDFLHNLARHLSETDMTIIFLIFFPTLLEN